MFGHSQKNLTFRGGISQKTNKEEELIKKGAWRVCRFKGACQERGGGVF